jgi:hypothetical protein
MDIEQITQYTIKLGKPNQHRYQFIVMVRHG